MKQKIKKRNEKREQRCFYPLLSNFLLIPNFAYFKTNQDSRKGVLFKLKQNGINGVLLNFIKDFTLFWKDRVVINSYYSTWSQCRHQSRLHPWVNNLHKQIVRESLFENVPGDDTSLSDKVYNVNPICTEGAQICAPLWKITRCMSNFDARTCALLTFNNFLEWLSLLN